MSTYDDFTRDVRLIRANGQDWSKRWRWDVKFYRGNVRVSHSGAPRPVHLGGSSGYTRTRLGALLEIGRRVVLPYWGLPDSSGSGFVDGGVA